LLARHGSIPTPISRVLVERSTVVNIPVTRYDTAVPTRRRPTTPEDLHRLAGLARDRGIRLFQESATGAWFATSATDANACYYVTGYSCTCEGFVYHQRCSHHAALLARLGWLPDIAAVTTAPTPITAAATVPCRACGGRGFDPACTGHATAAGVVTCECPVCADQDDDDVRWGDDIAESCPDDTSRFGAVAVNYHAA